MTHYSSIVTTFICLASRSPYTTPIAISTNIICPYASTKSVSSAPPSILSQSPSILPMTTLSPTTMISISSPSTSTAFISTSTLSTPYSPILVFPSVDSLPIKYDYYSDY